MKRVASPADARNDRQPMPTTEPADARRAGRRKQAHVPTRPMTSRVHLEARAVSALAPGEDHGRLRPTAWRHPLSAPWPESAENRTAPAGDLGDLTRGRAARSPTPLTPRPTTTLKSKPRRLAAESATQQIPVWRHTESTHSEQAFFCLRRSHLEPQVGRPPCARRASQVDLRDHFG